MKANGMGLTVLTMLRGAASAPCSVWMFAMIGVLPAQDAQRQWTESALRVERAQRLESMLENYGPAGKELRTSILREFQRAVVTLLAQPLSPDDESQVHAGCERLRDRLWSRDKDTDWPEDIAHQNAEIRLLLHRRSV